jgi:hypothetical protein
MWADVREALDRASPEQLSQPASIWLAEGEPGPEGYWDEHAGTAADAVGTSDEVHEAGHTYPLDALVLVAFRGATDTARAQAVRDIARRCLGRASREARGSDRLDFRAQSTSGPSGRPWRPPTRPAGQASLDHPPNATRPRRSNPSVPGARI